jgi:hypothetical protein
MLRSGGHITPANAYLLARQVVEPGLARELREDRTGEALRKKILGRKAVERVNQTKLIEGSKMSISDILGVVDAAEPLSRELNARLYTDKVTLDYGSNLREVSAEMTYEQRPMQRVLDIFLKGTLPSGQVVDASQEIRVLEEDDVRIAPRPGTIFDSGFVPLGSVPMGEDLVEFYDFTARVANAMMTAQQDGTLGVHGPSERIAALQSS